MALPNRTAITGAALLNVAEAAERLGLSPFTVRTWIARRRIAFVKVGPRAVRISEAEIDRLVNQGTVPARSVA